MVEELIGPKIIDCANKGAPADITALKSVKLIGLYFSAHWCGPCQMFTPMLAEFYNEVNSSGKQLEIVFCSGDHTLSQFQEYCATMPWKALPFQDPHVASAASKFKVTGIPRLIIMKPDGKVVLDDARADVQAKGPTAFDEWLEK